MKPLLPSLAVLVRALVLFAILGASLPLAASDAKTLDSLLGSVLAEHVKDGYVDYPAIARNARFAKYIDSLSTFDIGSLTDDKERLAFWINVYNALVIQNVIDGMSPNGPMDRMRFFGRNLEVGGKGYDLKTIEGDILAEFEDPRVYFAIVPATSSAPKLRAGAYVGEQVDQQLDEAARDFVNDKRRNRYSDALQAAKLSKVFEQHRKVFGKKDKELLRYIAQFVNDERVAKKLKRGTYDIKFMDYDATINGNSIQSH